MSENTKQVQNAFNDQETQKLNELQANIAEANSNLEGVRTEYNVVKAKLDEAAAQLKGLKEAEAKMFISRLNPENWKDFSAQTWTQIITYEIPEVGAWFEFVQRLNKHLPITIQGANYDLQQRGINIKLTRGNNALTKDVVNVLNSVLPCLKKSEVKRHYSSASSSSKMVDSEGVYISVMAKDLSENGAVFLLIDVEKNQFKLMVTRFYRTYCLAQCEDLQSLLNQVERNHYYKNECDFEMNEEEFKDFGDPY